MSLLGRALTAVGLICAALVALLAQPAAAVPSNPSISLGYSHACVVVASGDAYCWGRNDYGQLGNNTLVDTNTAVLVGGNHVWVSISAGYGYTCGVTQTHEGYCWGSGSYGVLGNGFTADTDAPSAVLNGYKWAAVDAGPVSTCGIRLTGGLYCWGSNFRGQLGTNDGLDHTSPAQAGTSTGWTQLSVGDQTTCGVDGGVAYCWGDNRFGQAGTGVLGGVYSTPQVVAGNISFSALSAGAGVTCGLATDNKSYCWGAGGLGALGNGDTSDHNNPQLVSGSHSLGQVTAGGGGACGMDSLGNAFCWGWNYYGSVGNGGNTNVDIPAAVLGIWSISSEVDLSAVVDPTFTFAVAPLNSGSCNGATVTAVTSTSTRIALRPTLSTNAVGGQTLTVTTNAGNGYVIFTRYSGTLSDGNGHTIADLGNPHSSPASFTSAGTPGFGFTTDHALTGGSTRFSGNNWASFTTGNQDAAVSTAPIASDVTHLCVQASIGASTVAASYQTTVINTAVPYF